MRLASLLLAALLPLTAAAAMKKEKKDLPPKHASRVRVGRQLFGRVFQVGRSITGAMVDDGTLPPGGKYKEFHGVTVALDSSWCAAQLGNASDPKKETEPVRLVDRGCTGSLSTTQVDWGGMTPTPMTQSRLDDIYSREYARLFGE